MPNTCGVIPLQNPKVICGILCPICHQQCILEKGHEAKEEVNHIADASKQGGKCCFFGAPRFNSCQGSGYHQGKEGIVLGWTSAT